MVSFVSRLGVDEAYGGAAAVARALVSVSMMRRLLDNVYQLMSEGTVSPILLLTTYRISELETAFRTLHTGKAIGKIVVAPHKDDQVKV